MHGHGHGHRHRDRCVGIHFLFRIWFMEWNWFLSCFLIKLDWRYKSIWHFVIPKTKTQKIVIDRFWQILTKQKEKKFSLKFLKFELRKAHCSELFNVFLSDCLSSARFRCKVIFYLELLHSIRPIFFSLMNVYLRQVFMKHWSTEWGKTTFLSQISFNPPVSF